MIVQCCVSLHQLQKGPGDIISLNDEHTHTRCSAAIIDPHQLGKSYRSMYYLVVVIIMIAFIVIITIVLSVHIEFFVFHSVTT